MRSTCFTAYCSSSSSCSTGPSPLVSTSPIVHAAKPSMAARPAFLSNERGPASSTLASSVAAASASWSLALHRTAKDLRWSARAFGADFLRAAVLSRGLRATEADPRLYTCTLTLAAAVCIL
eukprot:scaffold301_cov393-Prasinococcus_capsulatus_cf.AAC.12